MKGPILLTSWYMHICFAKKFFEAAYSLGITCIDCDICLTTSKKWVQNIKGQDMTRSTFWMIKYMNGSVFSNARYMDGLGFEILARTPVPKLPLSLGIEFCSETTGLHSVNRDVRGYMQNKSKLFICDRFRRMVATIIKLFSSCLLAQPKWRPMRNKIYACLFVTKNMGMFTALILFI